MLKRHLSMLKIVMLLNIFVVILCWFFVKLQMSLLSLSTNLICPCWIKVLSSFKRKKTHKHTQDKDFSFILRGHFKITYPKTCDQQSMQNPLFYILRGMFLPRYLCMWFPLSESHRPAITLLKSFLFCFMLVNPDCNLFDRCPYPWWTFPWDRCCPNCRQSFHVDIWPDMPRTDFNLELSLYIYLC